MYSVSLDCIEPVIAADVQRNVMLLINGNDYTTAYPFYHNVKRNVFQSISVDVEPIGVPRQSANVPQTCQVVVLLHINPL